jgi:hypothetical protein
MYLSTNYIYIMNKLKYYYSLDRTMSQTLFSPPAKINDFEQNSNLASRWNQTLERYLDSAINGENGIKDQGLLENEISIFDPRNPPSGQQSVINVTWGGFPNVLLAKYGRESALRRADQSPADRRDQDEYLEWAVHKDESTGKIKEVIFTCEGPEYWDTIAEDKELLLRLYRNLASPEVQLSDLFSNNGGYNRKNKWNKSHAIHLIQGANTLGAEIGLAARASILRKRNNEDIISSANELICCANYGEPTRNSDPTIGARINRAVRNGNWVSLNDPIGLYINDIDTSSFQKPDGSPITDFKDRYWKVIRGNQDDSTILRASVKVPEGEMFDGKQMLLGDLLVNGEPLQYGGQIADAITVGLYAVVIEGGPQTRALPCIAKCCIDPRFPNFEFTQTDLNRPCPTEGEIFTNAADDTLRKEVTDEKIPQYNNTRYAIS